MCVCARACVRVCLAPSRQLLGAVERDTRLVHVAQQRFLLQRRTAAPHSVDGAHLWGTVGWGVGRWCGRLEVPGKGERGLGMGGGGVGVRAGMSEGRYHLGGRACASAIIVAGKSERLAKAGCERELSCTGDAHHLGVHHAALKRHRHHQLRLDQEQRFFHGGVARHHPAAHKCVRESAPTRMDGWGGG